MDNIKDDAYHLEKIKNDLKFIIDHTKGKTQKQIEDDEVLVDSIMFRIIQLAENNSKLTNAFTEKHKEIPWLAIKGMRNKIVHDYGIVDLEIVYNTVSVGIPEMYELLINLKMQ